MIHASQSESPAGKRGSHMISELGWQAIAGELDLTQRQLEIVRCVFDDQTEFAIAQELGISQHTVHTHLERLHKKLGVHGRLDLVLLVLATFLRLTADTSSGLPPVCGLHTQGTCPLANYPPPTADPR